MSTATGRPDGSRGLVAAVYEEVRRLAPHKLANEAPAQTLQPTALVHEVWLRLGGNNGGPWKLASATDNETAPAPCAHLKQGVDRSTAQAAPA
jgi:hypothetical protein